MKVLIGKLLTFGHDDCWSLDVLMDCWLLRWNRLFLVRRCKRNGRFMGSWTRLMEHRRWEIRRRWNKRRTLLVMNLLILIIFNLKLCLFLLVLFPVFLESARWAMRLIWLLARASWMFWETPCDFHCCCSSGWWDNSLSFSQKIEFPKLFLNKFAINVSNNLIFLYIFLDVRVWNSLTIVLADKYCLISEEYLLSLKDSPPPSPPHTL